MRVFRLAVLTLTVSGFCLAASKETIELQRDVALLQDKMNTMQRTLDEKFASITVLLQQTQDNTSKTSNSLGSLQENVSTTVTNSVRPVSGISQKVDAMGDDVRSLKDTINDLNGRLERMDAKLTDLKNQIQIQQNPPPAPGSAPTGSGPGATPGSQAGVGGMPPAGMSAEKAYTDAMRDKQTGNVDLALKEFKDYLTYFPGTELAPNAQYYIGEIGYNKGDYNGAIQSFDAVLERYPENSKTGDSHYMKGLALIKGGQRNRAVQEFRALVNNYPRTENARRAQAQLKQLGVTATAAAPVPRRRAN